MSAANNEPADNPLPCGLFAAEFAGTALLLFIGLSSVSLMFDVIFYYCGGRFVRPEKISI